MTDIAKKVKAAIEPYNPLKKEYIELHQFSVDFYEDIKLALDDKIFDNENIEAICYTLGNLLSIMDKNTYDYNYWVEIYNKLKVMED